MLIDRIGIALGRAEGYQAVREILSRGEDAALAAPGLIRPALVAALSAHRGRPVMVVVAGEEAAERFARQAGAYLPQGRVLHLPARSDLPWSQEAPLLVQIGRRSRALHALDRGRDVVVVASARALLRTVPPQGSHVFEPLVLKPGLITELDAVSAGLARMGYQRVETAAEPGEFAVRGGVVDVFPSDEVSPLRAEFFGDELETLRRYVPSTGQTIGDVDLAEVYPAREVVLSSRGTEAASRSLSERAGREPRVAHELELMQQGIHFNGVERYLPLLYRRPGTAVEYVHASALVVVVEPRSLFADAVRASEEIAAAASAAHESTDGLFIGAGELDFGGRQRLTLLSLMRAGGAVDGELAARRPEVAGGEERFVGGVRSLLSAGHDVAVAVPDRRVRRRIGDALVGTGVPVVEHREHAARAREDAPVGADVAEEGAVALSDVDVPAGFVIPQAHLAVVSVEDVYPRAAARRRQRRVDPTQISFSFAPGDHVVHVTHGIALFREVVRQEVLGAERDYLLLEYARGDKLYVPVEQIDRVTRYVGPEGATPRVTRLNTADWSRATSKARTAARQLAFDLVDLYARRATVRGRAFRPDTPWQLEMEAAFPFEETPDQLAAIADVKADMESDTPMDRLICGDVGYGKTEVAIRAAFKAAQDDAQVMVLAPTTILAQQHYTTFSERFAAFPLRVDVLSRFRSSAEQRAILESFSAGEVDVLIGTHRLLSRDVTPRELGLVVIDEEQRFGVEHKEHLKNLREQVDVLAMTATPIPRTLQMGLSGVRDMSVIDTPPPNRFPVAVHVGEWDEDVVSAAIRRESERGGQVYYVSNRVRTIDDALERVRRAAPEVRVGVAHGQMTEKQLERIMESFAAGEFDVLVATTIIESGIDNPHTNTLIIEDSQRLGLAQLYQLKGRVGRSHVRAFAYFMFPRTSALTEQATERLTAIKDHAELGSGIQVAMRDLEIRGAGSLLGAEQHGNVSAVGFDLFAQMLAEAVSEVRGEPPAAHPDVRVDLGRSVFLPEDYVPAIDERVRFYRRLAGSPTIEAVDAVARDLVDLFGDPPAPTVSLLDAARIRALAAEAGIESVSVTRRRLLIGRIELDDGQWGRVAALGAVRVDRGRGIALPLDSDEDASAGAFSILDAILSGARDTE